MARMAIEANHIEFVASRTPDGAWGYQGSPFDIGEAEIVTMTPDAAVVRMTRLRAYALLPMVFGGDA